MICFQCGHVLTKTPAVMGKQPVAVKDAKLEITIACAVCGATYEMKLTLTKLSTLSKEDLALRQNRPQHVVLYDCGDWVEWGKKCEAHKDAKPATW